MAYDDDDDYDAFISKLAAGSDLNSPEPAAATRGGGNAAGVDQLLAQMASYSPNPRDKQLGESWRDEEQKTLERVQGGDDYDLGKILRDIAPLAIGTVADVASNHGRGMGDIASAAMVNAAQNAARDEAAQKANRDYALKMREQREKSDGGTAFDRAYKQLQVLNERERIGLASQNTGLRGQTVEQGAVRTKIAADQNSYLNNPDDPRTIQLKAQLIANGVDPSIANMSAAALRDRKVVTGHEVDHAFSNLEREDAAKKAAATSAASTGAEIKTKAGLADVSAGTESKIAGAREAATTKAGIETAADLSDVSAATKEKEAGAATQGRLGAEQAASADSFLDPLARTVVDPERAERVKRNPELAKKASESLRASSQLVDTISNMVDIRQKEAQGLIAPGRAASQMETERIRLEGAFARANDQGTINEGDRQAMATFLGKPGASLLDLSGLFGGDIKLDQLKGVRDMLAGADERTAREYGFGAYGTAPISQMAPAPSRSRAAPASSAAPAAPGGGMVTIRLNGETAQVPADQAQRLKAANPSLEVL
jgi:hypothetical protein